MANKKNPIDPRPTISRPWFWRSAQGLVVLGALWAVAQFYIPGVGFTRLLTIGDQFDSGRLSALSGIDYYTEQGSPGYDGQHYAKLALDPLLNHPADLSEELDNLPYRARRILLSWTAWLFGFGQPWWILQAFALQNVVAWLLLGWVITRWIPVVDLRHFLAWAGVMGSCGLLFSIRGALVDGPSLLLMALALRWQEDHRSRWSDLMFSASGLARETNLLGLIAWIDTTEWRMRTWSRWMFRGLAVAAPLAGWMVFIRHRTASSLQAGTSNFGMPWAAFARKWIDVIADVIVQPGWSTETVPGLLLLFSLTVQSIYLVLNPSFRDPWWRVGASFVVLMALLGDAVWDGYPEAAVRVLLPITLAFNIQMVTRRAAWGWLILGNLSLLVAPTLLSPPPAEAAMVRGSRDLRVAEDGQARVTIAFGAEWHDLERQSGHAWHWSTGSSTLTIFNPHPYGITADLDFGIKAISSRPLLISLHEQELWQGTVASRRGPMHLTGLKLIPGKNVVSFITTEGTASDHGDVRKLAIEVTDLRVELRTAVKDSAKSKYSASVLSSKAE